MWRYDNLENGFHTRSRPELYCSPCVAASASAASINSPDASISSPEPEDDWVPRFNIAPAQDIPVIRQQPEEPKRFGSKMRWGLIPFWAKDATIGYKMINARAETVATKPAFREALLLPQALGVGARSAEPRCHQ
jgi:putative SOS response-associated peptidase YedK